MTPRPDLARPADPRTRLATLPSARHWLLISILGVLLTVGFGLTVKLAPGIAATELRLDLALSQHQHPAIGWVAIGLSTLFSPAGNVIILAVSFLYLLLVRRAPVNAVAFTALAAFGWLSSEAVKLAVAMARPDGRLLHHPLLAEAGHDSYPSGHTTFVASYVLACVLLAVGTRWLLPTALAGTVLVAAVAGSRLYVGAHYLSDVTGSVLLALTAAVFFAGIWNRLGLAVLNRIPLLRRFGPVPERTAPRRATWARAVR